MLADETLSLDSGVEVLPPLKKLLESAGSQEKAAHLSEITDDFLHMDKLQFLPPCKVCRGAATGFHYGANTCEACKAFFRRYTGQESNLKPCKKTSQCAETAKKGKISCAKCRYKRCIKIGMTKEGIKKGRYTYEKRFRDAMELRKRQKLDEKEKLLNPDISRSLLDVLAGGFSNSFPDVNYILNERTAVEKQINQLLTKRPCNLDRTVVTFDGSIGEENGDRDEQLFYSYVERLADPYTNIESSPVSIDSSTTSGSKTTASSTDSISTNSRMVSRSKMIWLGLSSQFQKALASICTFATMIPGFSMLPFEDKLILLKSACVEVQMLLRASSINHDTDTLVKYYPDTRDIRLVPLSLLSLPALTPDFIEFHNKLTSRIVRLRLNITNLSALLPCIIMNPDQQGLQSTDKIDFIQKSLIPVLEYSLNHSHPGDVNIVPDTLLLLPMLRESTEKYFFSHDC